MRFLLLLLLLGCSSPVDAQPQPLAPVTVVSSPSIPKEIPREALIYRRTIIREAHYYWGLDAPSPLFFAQIHQESRFKATAESKYASGLSQFTPATAKGMQEQYPDLRVLCTNKSGCALEPGWAIRAMMLYDRALYKTRDFAIEYERRAFMLADYNGGAGWINRERRYCDQSGECDTDAYFGEVETACGKSSPARADWACKENRHYPRVILETWMPVYHKWLSF